MRRRPFLPLLSACLLLVACTVPLAPSSLAPPSPGRSAPLDLDVLARQVHAETNRARARHGLPPLRWEPSYARLAAGHSRDMAARRYVAHRSPEGHDVNGRARRLGLECRFSVDADVVTSGASSGRTYVGFAENLFSLYEHVGWSERRTARDVERTVEMRAPATLAPAVVQQWLRSPGHRRTLLAPQSQAEGVAVARTSEGQLFITQVFC